VRPPARILWRWYLSLAWSTLWPALAVLVLAAMALSIALAGGLGCVSGAQTALAAATRTVAGAMPALLDAREDDGARCFEGTPTHADAAACLDAVRAKWAPVWAAVDVLEAVDEAALAGELRLEDAARAYCALARVVELPALPAALGRCEP
jgi:hypothetical protein